MDDLDGFRSPLQAAWINASRTEGGLAKQTRLFLEALLVVMCLGAVIGNVLVIVIVAATRTLHAVTSVLILNLAISDLLVGIGVMPFVAMSIINTGWVHCSVLCLFVGYSSTVYCTASVLTLTAIALDRYYSIMDCLRYNSRCTLWRTCAVVLWIWFQALVVCSPPLLGWSSVTYVIPMYNCATTWGSTLSYTAFIATLTYLIPAVVILFCYLNIIMVARSHARRIHSLEDSIQRSRSPCAPWDSSHQCCRNLQRPWRVTCHINKVSQISKEGENISQVVQETPTQQRKNQQHHHHHGAMRLLLIISAFFLCWTPYICVALVQATETAITGRSTLVPDSVITFSYWLMLLSSDVNPLLYALLSQRFQIALQGLVHKIRAYLWIVLGREWEVRAEGDDVRNSDPCTLITAHPSSHSSTESLNCDNSKYSSIFTVSTDFKSHSEVLVCDAYHYEKNTSSVCQDAACDKTHNLQVPSRPQEGNRLPFSALTSEPQATFFFGPITVTVEHDVC
ncbi:5-hydroxytryptamine receptor 1D isoform X2 [Girardinichthys multiradiatus]|uniref:5-hydroxytryptamine receptor 1D isoform X2 n=1 Tax=Girardinichthys multiradiatus TaxID=208333 RepID=UPI001FAB7EEB|nr:5-hydroxytryptamine receptor 1D isoform X2 [Girardinichthys multiradiatus]